MAIYSRNKLSCCNRQTNTKLRFGKAQLNGLVESDSHGHLKQIANLDETIKENVDNIFPDRYSNSTANRFFIVGDWFIDPSNKTYIGYPNNTSGDFQAVFLK